MNYLSLDIGTTCCKSQLFDEKGEILKYLAIEYPFLQIDGENYVNVQAIMQNVEYMIAETAKQYPINSICISSLGESFVLLDQSDEILFYPMLYTDPRGEREAEYIKEKVGEQRGFEITGVIAHSMFSVSKLLWISNNHPDAYNRAQKLLLIGDYVGYKLTGERVIDYSLASRTGVFDIQNKCFSAEILEELGIDGSLFSKPALAGSVVGRISDDIVKRLNVKGDPVLVLGSHDQVCTALGAGVLQVGEAVDGMGTVECITTLFDKKCNDIEMGRQGYVCAPYAIDGVYCTYLINYSCGSAINWFKSRIMHDYKGSESSSFCYLESKMPEGPSGILFLPYLAGAASPNQDVHARAAFINLTARACDGDLYKAIMEGLSMEMLLNQEVAEQYAINICSAVATGGCANSRKLMQIKADVQNVEYKILRSSEGGLCGLAMLQAVALGEAKDLHTARDIFVRYGESFLPRAEVNERYMEQYQKYKKLYKALKEFN